MKTCYHCAQPIEGESVITRSYWKGLPFDSHPACKIAGERADALECQTIDADCNDCKHFKRGEVIKQRLSCMENQRASMKLVNMGYISGHCLKFDRPTEAEPNKWTGLQCFEHRKTPTPEGKERNELPTNQQRKESEKETNEIQRT